MERTGNSSADCPCRRALLRKSIFTAAQDGDIHHVRSFFECRKAHLPIDFVDDFGYTALHYASQANHLDVVKYLLSRGANPDCAKCGAAPLHRAAYSGAQESVSLLVLHGASLNIEDTSFGDRRTPLHKAASRGHSSIVDILVKAGADTTLRDAGGLTYDQVPLDLGWQEPSDPGSTGPNVVQVPIDDSCSTVGLGRQCESCGGLCFAATKRACCSLLQCDACSDDQSQPCHRCGAWSHAIQPVVSLHLPAHNSTTSNAVGADLLPPSSTATRPPKLRGLFSVKLSRASTVSSPPTVM